MRKPRFEQTDWDSVAAHVAAQAAERLSIVVATVECPTHGAKACSLGALVGTQMNLAACCPLGYERAIAALRQALGPADTEDTEDWDAPPL